MEFATHASSHASPCPPLASSTAWPFLTFSPAELRYLVEIRQIEPSSSGLLEFLIDQEPLEEGERGLAEDRLREKGWMDFEPTEAAEFCSEAGALFAHSLRVLARPQARLLIAHRSPGQAPSLIPLFLSGELAVPGFLDTEGLHAGAPLDRAHLTESVEQSLQSDPWHSVPWHRESPTAAPSRPGNSFSETVTLPALALRTVEALWADTGRGHLEVIPQQEALEILDRRLEDSDLSESAVAHLLESGLAAESGRGYRLAESYLPWLESVLSGHACELEYTSLDTMSELEESEAERLFFVGPPGRRVLYSLENEGDSSAREATEIGNIRLSSLPGDYLSWYLQRFLHFD